MLVVPGTFCSLRWGELAALTRDAVDLERGVVHVRVTLVELADGHLATGPPKSAAGRRVVAISPSLLPVVATHLNEFVGPDSSDLGPQGAPVRRSNFQKHWVAPVGTAGVPAPAVRPTRRGDQGQNGLQSGLVRTVRRPEVDVRVVRPPAAEEGPVAMALQRFDGRDLLGRLTQGGEVDGEPVEVGPDGRQDGGRTRLLAAAGAPP